MSYAVYVSYTNRTAKYHETGCSRIKGSCPTRNGHWRRDLPDVDAVFREGMEYGAKAV